MHNDSCRHINICYFVWSSKSCKNCSIYSRNSEFNFCIFFSSYPKNRRIPFSLVKCSKSIMKKSNKKFISFISLVYKVTFLKKIKIYLIIELGGQETVIIICATFHNSSSLIHNYIDAFKRLKLYYACIICHS